MTERRTDEAEHHDPDVHIGDREKDEPPGPTGAAAAGQGEPDEIGPRGKRRSPILIGGILVIALLIGVGFYYWLSTRNIKSTDDAFIDGRAVSIAPQVSGQVVSLDVTDNQFVRKGQPLIHIDPRQYVNDQGYAQGVLDTAKSQLAGLRYGAEIARKNFPALLEQAQAQLASAQAAEVRAQADYQRQRSLPRQATTSRRSTPPRPLYSRRRHKCSQPRLKYYKPSLYRSRSAWPMRKWASKRARQNKPRRGSIRRI